MPKVTNFDVPFTQVPNQLLLDKDLSLKAKGLWTYMQSKPNNWDFSAARIAKELSEGRDAILSALKELIEIGYVRRVKKPSGHIEYKLLVKPKTEKPTVGKPHQGESPPWGKPFHNKESIIKNKVIKKESLIKKEVDPTAQKLEEALLLSVRRNLPNLIIKDPQGKWANEIEKIHRIDGYDWQTIIRVASWSQRDKFWQKQIRSGGNLRAKFETLLAQSSSARGGVYGDTEAIDKLFK